MGVMRGLDPRTFSPSGEWRTMAGDDEHYVYIVAL
jgi:hypothetical protein